MNNRYKLFLSMAFALCIWLTSCVSTAPLVEPQPPIDSALQDETKESSVMKYNEDIITDGRYTVLEGKVISLRQETYSETTYESYAEKVIKTINNAVRVYCERFVFCEDGSVVDLYDTEYRINEVVEPSSRDYYFENECTISVLEELNKTCGIKDIRFANDGNAYHVYAGDGYIYELDSLLNIDYKKFKDPVLNDDGTLNCNEFPETSSWTNVIDYRLSDDFIIALTSDGKVLSSGTEFNLENIKKIDIFNMDYICWLPVSLTFDGNLVFGEFEEDYSSVTSEYERSAREKLYEALRESVRQSEALTELEDFFIEPRLSDLLVLGKKFDGTFISTTNDLYNPEYVGQVETVEKSDKSYITEVFETGIRDRSYLDPIFAVFDGKVTCIRTDYLFLKSDKETVNSLNAKYVDESHFIYCDDGTIKTLNKGGVDTVFNIYNILETDGIHRIENRNHYSYITTENGKVYYYSDECKEIEAKKITWSNRDYRFSIVLRNDGTVYCMDIIDHVDMEKFPELSTWSDIVDVSCGKDFVVGLKSNGEVVSTGIDFSEKNIVMIDTFETVNMSIPMALTADGKLVVPEQFQTEPAISEALSFTDIVDFLPVGWESGGAHSVILAKKSDGSLIATKNEFFDPEYVQMEPVEKEEIQVDIMVQDSEKTIQDRSFIDPMYVVENGKVICYRYKNSYLMYEKVAESIENALYVDEKRFVYCDDGSVELLYEYNPHSYGYMMAAYVKSINRKDGICKIESFNEEYVITTKNGKVYYYFKGIKELEAKKMTQPEYDSSFWIVLNHDGTVYCMDSQGEVDSEKFPELSNWTDIFDVSCGRDFVIGLKSNGEIVSTGIDFSAENIVMIDVVNWWRKDIPMALTSDGNIIVPEQFKSEPAICDAISYTDVVDFLPIGGINDDVVILAKKADGSIMGTDGTYYSVS